MSVQPGSFFPEGVFGSDANDGRFDLVLRRGRSQIVFDFHTRVSYVGMSAFQARQIAHALVRYAEVLEREANDLAPGQPGHLGGVREAAAPNTDTPPRVLE